MWAVASCNCNGLWKTSARSFLLALYAGPWRCWAKVLGGAGGDAVKAQPGYASAVTKPRALCPQAPTSAVSPSYSVSLPGRVFSLCACLGTLMGLPPAPRCDGFSFVPLLCPHLPPATVLCAGVDFVGGKGSCFSLSWPCGMPQMQLFALRGGWLWKPGPALRELLTPILTCCKQVTFAAVLCGKKGWEPHHDEGGLVE